MKELELREQISIRLVQFECPACSKKIYVNAEDVKESDVLDCPFCDVKGIDTTRVFDVEIKKIFVKE